MMKLAATIGGAWRKEHLMCMREYVGSAKEDCGCEGQVMSGKTESVGKADRVKETRECVQVEGLRSWQEWSLGSGV